MSSELQIQANRRNSQKSTGPRTVSGKAASSRNRTTSGIYAESHIVIGESQSDLADLAAAFAVRFQPDTPEQHTLVDIMIHAEWILRRLRRAETGLWNTYIADHDSTGDDNELGRAFNCRDATFTRLQRRLDSLQRNFERAHKELKRLQAERPAVLPVPEPAPRPAAQESVLGFAPPAQIGFDPSPARRAALRVPPATMEKPCPLPVISTPSPASAETCSSAR